jgi:hypothetical protein
MPALLFTTLSFGASNIPQGRAQPDKALYKTGGTYLTLSQPLPRQLPLYPVYPAAISLYHRGKYTPFVTKFSRRKSPLYLPQSALELPSLRKLLDCEALAFNKLQYQRHKHMESNALHSIGRLNACELQSWLLYTLTQPKLKNCSTSDLLTELIQLIYKGYLEALNYLMRSQAYKKRPYEEILRLRAIKKQARLVTHPAGLTHITHIGPGSPGKPDPSID